MKTLLRLVSVVFLFLSVSGFADESIDEFVFMDMITWNSTIDEAVQFFGENAQRIDDADEAIGTATALLIKDIPVYEHVASDVGLLFFDGRLLSIEIAYMKEEISDVQALIRVLEQIYGPSEKLHQDETTLSDLLYGTQLCARWRIGGNTEIQISDFSESEGQYQYYITINNNEGWEYFTDKIEDMGMPSQWTTQAT